VAEKVLTMPLSGEEVRKAILDKIGLSLSRDCFLSANLAYEFFEAHVTVSLKLRDVGRVESVEQDVKVSHGENDDQFIEAAEAEFDIPAEDPTTVRVESGQEVPVLTRDTEGRPEIKGIKYARKKGKNAD
jgi:hypothetical protein